MRSFPFDGLGGSTALFYLRENDAIATVNKVEAKMLCATFKDGDLDRILYFEGAKNDAYPVVQLPAEEQRMKGFDWKPELRPTGLHDLTDLKPRDSERKSYASHQKPEYPQTEIYFPGYMKQAFKDIEEARKHPKRKAGGPAESPADGSTDTPSGDSSVSSGDASPSDTTAVKVPGPVGGDGDASPSDTTAVKAHDQVGGDGTQGGTKAGKLTKEERKAERERLKAEKQAARETRWAMLDARDAAKADIKKQKKLEKKRKATLKALQREAARAAREKALYEKYRQHYLDKEAKKQKQ